MIRRACAMALALLAACTSSDTSQSRRPVVLAAASLATAFEELDEDALYNFAGSDELAIQIQEGARADVFAAASPREPRTLFELGLVEEPVAFAANELVIVVPVSNPAAIGDPEDLASSEVKLVIGAPGVPVGDYAREMLRRLDLDAVLGNVVSEEEDVRGIVSKVSLGEADAGIVYATDAVSARRLLATVAIPSRAQPEIVYEVAVLTDAPHREAAREFVETLLSPDGQAVLRAAGFGAP